MSKAKSTKVPELGTLVHVVWKDASTSAGWGRDRRFPALSTVQSVGYLRHATRRRLVVAASYSDSGEWGERTAIPRGNVKAIRRCRVRKPGR